METSKGIIDFSVTESKNLGLKIGRCNHDYFDQNLLKVELIDGCYDLCRVKIAAEDEFAAMRLDQLGIPYYFSGSIRRYKTAIKDVSELNLLNPTLQFEKYTPAHSNLLFDMLKETWGNYPIGYYRSPILDQLITRDMEIYSVFDFYRRQNGGTSPNNTIIFMKDNGIYVGFFALNHVGKNLESHIGGILPPCRKGGYFHDMLVFIKKYCASNQLSHFVFGARNENAQVQKIFFDAGFNPVGTENVFHVVPLISKVLDKGKIVRDEIKINESTIIKKYFIDTPKSKITRGNRIIFSLANNKFSFIYTYDTSGCFLQGEISQKN